MCSSTQTPLVLLHVAEQLSPFSPTSILTVAGTGGAGASGITGLPEHTESRSDERRGRQYHYS